MFLYRQVTEGNQQSGEQVHWPGHRWVGAGSFVYWWDTHAGHRDVHLPA